MPAPGSRLAWMAVAAFALALTSCNRVEPPRQTSVATSASPQTSPPAASNRAAPEAVRDLEVDESRGGHTLARHVGKSDAELRDRLRREPQISAASTYSDRATAERSVGAALASGGRQLAAWENRTGRRPNLVLHYTTRGQPLGRSLARGQRQSAPSVRALVVLRWDERSGRYFVLTSYPEAER